MKSFWQNSHFTKRINELHHRKYSIGDLDGFVQKDYKLENDSKIYYRRIFIEVKNKHEGFGSSSLFRLLEFKKFFDWTRCDNKSGVFILRNMDKNIEFAENFEVYSIIEKSIN